MMTRTIGDPANRFIGRFARNVALSLMKPPLGWAEVVVIFYHTYDLLISSYISDKY